MNYTWKYDGVAGGVRGMLRVFCEGQQVAKCDLFRTREVPGDRAILEKTLIERASVLASAHQLGAPFDALND